MRHRGHQWSRIHSACQLSDSSGSARCGYSASAASKSGAGPNLVSFTGSRPVCACRWRNFILPCAAAWPHSPLSETALLSGCKIACCSAEALQAHTAHICMIRRPHASKHPGGKTRRLQACMHGLPWWHSLPHARREAAHLECRMQSRQGARTMRRWDSKTSCCQPPMSMRFSWYVCERVVHVPD